MSKLCKKLAVFALASVMLLSAMACSSNAPKTMFDAMRQALEIKTYNLELEMTLKAQGEKVVIEAIGDVDKDAQAASLDLYFEYGGSGFDIGNITVKDGVMYIDITKLLNDTGLDEDTVSALFEQSGVDPSAFESLTVYGLKTGETGSEAIAASEALTEHMIAALEKGAEEDASAVSGKDGSWSLELDGGNISAVGSGIIAYVSDNLDDIWDNMMTVMEASQDNQLMNDMKDLSETVPGVDVDMTEVEDMLENADSYKDTVAAALESALDSIDDLETIATQADVEMSLDFSYSGKKNNHVCEMVMRMTGGEGDEAADIEISAKLTEGEVEIEAPDEYTDALELLSLLGGMTDGGNVLPDEPQNDPIGSMVQSRRRRRPEML